jgi:DNA-binding MarR family transcriptional regulator
MTSATNQTLEATFLAIVRASEELQRGFVELFKAHELTLAQYNVLRILRGAGPEGLTCGDVASNLLRHDPDVTRLVDRLHTRKLVERERDGKDRRVVRTRITPEGEALLRTLDGPVTALHANQFGHISETRLSQLTALLDEARAAVP